MAALGISATAILPGLPYYAKDGQGAIGGAIVVSALVVFGLTRGSRLAWFAAIAFSAGGVALGVFSGLEPKFVLIGVIDLIAVVLLLSPGMDKRVWRRTAAST
jgi:hypothetical protein